MEKELKQINKKLAEIESMCAKLIDLLIGQDIKLDEVKKIREGKPVFNNLKGGKGK